jgi:two-component system, LytTR family, sensor kinase
MKVTIRATNAVESATRVAIAPARRPQGRYCLSMPTVEAAPFSRRALMRGSAVVWISCGLLQCAQSYVQSLATGREWDLARALTNAMPWWLTWFALTPVLALLAARFPVSGRRWTRSLVALIAAGVAVCSVQLTAAGTAHWFATGQFAGVATSATNQIQRFFGSFFVESLLTYAAAVGVLVAIDFARAVRDERVTRARAEAEASKAQLAALAMELNPHFLFNTMSAISGLIAQGRSNDAREVVRRLSDLLRKTLETGSGQQSTMAREVELLEDYLYIQRMRFSDRLTVGVEVDAHARNCTIPPMLLQPLVENAIRHGVELTEGHGDVRIHVVRNNGSLRIAITDSGGGFQRGGNGIIAREGVGIANTRARLEHLYRANATLELRNRAEGGAEVVVVIPATEQ